MLRFAISGDLEVDLINQVRYPGGANRTPAQVSQLVREYTTDPVILMAKDQDRMVLVVADDTVSMEDPEAWETLQKALLPLLPQVDWTRYSDNGAAAPGIWRWEGTSFSFIAGSRPELEDPAPSHPPATSGAALTTDQAMELMERQLRERAEDLERQLRERTRERDDALERITDLEREILERAAEHQSAKASAQRLRQAVEARAEELERQLRERTRESAAASQEATDSARIRDLLRIFTRIQDALERRPEGWSGYRTPVEPEAILTAVRQEVQFRLLEEERTRAVCAILSLPPQAGLKTVLERIEAIRQDAGELRRIRCKLGLESEPAVGDAILGKINAFQNRLRDLSGQHLSEGLPGAEDPDRREIQEAMRILSGILGCDLEWGAIYEAARDAEAGNNKFLGALALAKMREGR